MFESSNPSKDREHLKFRRLKLEPGKSAKGWKSGPAIGVPCHFFGRTKPCIKALTKGALPCPCQIQKVKEGWVGYMPYFDEGGRKLVVLYGRESHESVERIPFGGPIKIVKGNFPAAPVYVTVDSWTTSPCPWIRALKCEHEIRPWLLTLWGIEELKNYFASDPIVPKKIVDPDELKDALFENPPPLPKLGEIFKAKQQEGVVNRVEDVLKNGSHKKQKPGKK